MLLDHISKVDNGTYSFFNHKYVKSDDCVHPKIYKGLHVHRKSIAADCDLHFAATQISLEKKYPQKVPKHRGLESWGKNPWLRTKTE